ncbi:DUF5710 domain-containing protein [Massilia sp. YIM B02443]|uniref:DUF5710 domain-containing protein n=1 Tax=Massilia sp. YIM B02443 TaxID=3050127 RepID=UPI0025B67BB6|nr:DUF5710 domain-containing protein [Massilia sp. YIM B02443]MDN4039543.1 DUF5710 domain-containing protein [Massilia sp. YIM B02443]
MVLLNVPYAEKDAAKALGARWNPTRRRWYVPDGVAAEPFAKWVDGAAGAAGAAAPGTAPAAARPGRVDSYQGKTVVGANYLELGHDCNPLEPCPVCSGQLAGTPWAQAQAGLHAVIVGLSGK